jgi:hypothetical protein
VENRIEIHQKIKNSQTLVAHICNPSFLGGWDQKGHSSKSALEKSLQDPILVEKKLCVVAYSCHPSKGRRFKQEDHGPGWSGPKARP